MLKIIAEKIKLYKKTATWTIIIFLTAIIGFISSILGLFSKTREIIKSDPSQKPVELVIHSALEKHSDQIIEILKQNGFDVNVFKTDTSLTINYSRAVRQEISYPKGNK